jgi:hypothetical protein
MDRKKAGMFAVIAGVTLLAGAAIAAGTESNNGKSIWKIDRYKLDRLEKSKSITTREGNDVIEFSPRYKFIINTMIDRWPSYDYSKPKTDPYNQSAMTDKEKLMLVAMAINESMLNPRAVDNRNPLNPARTLLQLSKLEFERITKLLGYTESDVIPPSDGLSDEQLKPYIQRQSDMALEMAIEKGFFRDLRNRTDDKKILGLCARWTGCAGGSWTNSVEGESFYCVKATFEDEKYAAKKYSAKNPPASEDIPGIIRMIHEKRHLCKKMCTKGLLSRLLTYRQLAHYLLKEET